MDIVLIPPIDSVNVSTILSMYKLLKYAIARNIGICGFEKLYFISYDN